MHTTTITRATKRRTLTNTMTTITTTATSLATVARANATSARRIALPGISSSVVARFPVSSTHFGHACVTCTPRYTRFRSNSTKHLSTTPTTRRVRECLARGRRSLTVRGCHLRRSSLRESVMFCGMCIIGWIVRPIVWLAPVIRTTFHQSAALLVRIHMFTDTSVDAGRFSVDWVGRDPSLCVLMENWSSDTRSIGWHRKQTSTSGAFRDNRMIQCWPRHALGGWLTVLMPDCNADQRPLSPWGRMLLLHGHRHEVMLLPALYKCPNM